MEILKDDEGQVLLLSALVACACLITLTTYLYSISAASAIEYQGFQRETLDNALWTCDLGLSQVAAITGSCPWELREELAATFKSKADKPVNGIREKMMAHGIAYSFVYNETLAAEYIEDNAVAGTVDIGGILVKRDEGNAIIYGYAFDLMLSDGTSRYCISQVKTWDI